MNDLHARVTASVRRIAYIVLSALLVGYVIAFGFATRAAYMDDAFIGFQFIHNLVQGYGFVFYAGQPPVEGVTNIGWLLLLAPATLLLAPPVAAKIFGGGLVLATVLLTERSARRAQSTTSAADAPLFALLPALVVATNVHFLYFSLAGMESALLAMLLLAMAVRAASTPDSRLLPVLGALCFTIHPEAVLVFPLYMLLIVRMPALAWRTWLVNFGVWVGFILVVTALRLAYFHAWLPNTFAAKPSSDARIIYNVYMTLLGTNINIPFPATTLFAVVVILVGGATLRSTQRPLVAMLGSIVYTGLLFGVYAPPDWTALGRYSAPYMPATVVLLWQGSTTIVTAYLTGKRWQPVGTLALAIALVGAGLSSTLEQTQAATLARYPGYVLASTTLIPPARWMDEHLPPDAIIATRRIGVLGYYTQRRVFDYTFGLTEPNVTQLIAANRHSFDDPNDPALAAQWQSVQPDALIEDEEKLNQIVQHAGGTPERFIIHGIPYRVVQHFTIGVNVRWSLALRIGVDLR